jgi:SAM-dependent methyltransferase
MISEMPQDVASHREWLLSLVPTPETGLWVDLGCGSGADAIKVGARHPQCELRIVGLDSSAKSIASALAAAEDDRRLEFRRHDLNTALPFDTATIDVAYSHNLIECLGDGAAFAREVARILRPGGCMVMAHWDWDSQLFDGTDKALIRRLVHAYADWQQAWMEYADGWMGRRLWGTFNSTGLFTGAVHARVLTNTVYSQPWFGYARAQDFSALVRRGLAAAEDYNRFVGEQEALSAQGRYFYSITGFAYVAQLLAA